MTHHFNITSVTKTTNLTLLPNTPFTLPLPGIPGDQVGIVFPVFGTRVSRDDTSSTFGAARRDVIADIEAHPRQRYVAAGRRIWHVGSTELTLLPGPRLTHGDLLVLLAGCMFFFRHFEFVETDMSFRRIGDGGWRKENLMGLGSARLRDVG